MVEESFKIKYTLKEEIIGDQNNEFDEITTLSKEFKDDDPGIDLPKFLCMLKGFCEACGFGYVDEIQAISYNNNGDDIIHSSEDI